MQYEDFYALELEAEMRDEEEVWTNMEDEMYLDMVTAWEKDFQDKDFLEDLKLRKEYRW
jgi:phosphoribosyl-ATP pyrophosphohydrolase